MVDIYVNDTFIASTVVAPGGNVSFDQELGFLNAGDTIYVSAGTYAEHLVFSIPVNLIGEGAKGIKKIIKWQKEILGDLKS